MNASTYGMTIPSIYGCIKSNFLAIWAQNLRTGGSGKKAKKKGIQTYVEQIDFLIGSNPIQGFLQFWENNYNRYALNFVKQRSALSHTVTITDAEFYFVVGVTAEVSLSGTFNDYGGQGSQAWGPTVYEYPLWNKALQGPDLVDASGARWWPYTFKWVPADGAVVLFPDIANPPIILPTNGFVDIYYAQLSALIHNEVPAAHARLTFEPQLANNNTAYAGFTAQQIIMPEYAGASSFDIDLGATGLIPQTRAEVMGSFSVYPRGDADFLDMIEDILKSGMMQVGSQLGLIHRGVNLNDLPGSVQKDFFQVNALSIPKATFWQPNTGGSRLIAITRSRPFGGTPTIADVNGNTWNSVFLNTQKGMWYSNPCVAGPTAGGNTVTCTPATGSGFNSETYIVELDPDSTTLDNTATNSGSGGNATCSITTTGTPSYIVAVIFCDDGIFPITPPAHWDLLFPAAINSWDTIFKRTVQGPGTYSIKFSVGSGTNWWVAMIAFTQPQAPAYPKALGNIFDSATALVARAGCRANGLIGSASLDSQKTAADWLSEIYQCANTAPVWSGFRLKSIFRSEVSAVGNGVVYTAPTAAGPVMNITENDLIGDSSSPLITVADKTPGIDDANILQIEFIDRGSDYNPSVASWPEQGSVSIFGPKKGGLSDDNSTGSPQALHEIMDPMVARKLLAIQARRNAMVAPRTYKFKGKTQLALLEPMDLVTINDSLLGISMLPVRLKSVAEDDEHNIDFEAEPFFYGVHAPDTLLTVTANAPYGPNASATPASVNTPIFLEPVPRLAGQTTAQLWAVVSDTDPIYGGCAVYLSTDGGVSYNLVGTIAGNAVTGVTTADWPIATDPDTTNDLPLNLAASIGTLLSYQIADEDNFVYPCYISGGNASIPYGLMTYALATLTGTNLYTLKATGGGTNHLRRCVYGAPALLTDVDHPLGSRWAFLNPSGQGIFKINMDPKWIGQTLHFKFLAFNTFQGGQQALATATDYTFTPTGIPGNATGGSNNTYTISGGALTNPTTTSIAMAQATATFQSGLKLNYNARTFTITAPSVPTTYYVTIADPGLTGDAGTATSLTATCQTSNALVGAAGNIYIGSIQAVPAGGGTGVGPGGSPTGIAGTAFFDGIIPTGSIPGSTFTLPSPPNPTSSLLLVRNGATQTQGVDYTLTGSSFTYAIAMAAGDAHICWFRG